MITFQYANVTLKITLVGVPTSGTQSSKKEYCMKTFSIVSAVALVLSVAFAATLHASEAMTPEANEPIMKLPDDPSWKLDFTDAEKIAVQEGRRKKPLQTFAFETVEQIVGRPLMGATFYKDQSNGAKLNAMDLYLSIWFFPSYWEDKPLILVSNSELRNKLILPPSVISADAAAYAGTGKEQYFDEKRLSIKDLLRGPLQEMLVAMKEKPEDKLTALEKDAKLVFLRIQLYYKIKTSFEELALVPHPSDIQGTWDSMAKLFSDTRNAGGDNAKSQLAYNYEASKKACEAYLAFRDTYKTRDVAGFALASKNLKESLQALSPEIYPTDTKLSVEVQYNNERPFAKAWIFYLLAALTSLFALRVKAKPIYWTAMLLYLGGLALHIYGFALRCYIAGRPPVSNMYESVIWVGFGAVFFGLIFETIYRKRYYMLAGSTAGFLCLVLMDLVPVLVGNNEAQGFTKGIEPLQPVLRDNFWLTVHVLTITLSYAAFMLAWGMGHISLFSHLTRPDERAEHRELHTLVYRIMQVGVLLLSIGTILGGVWAYYSWGRFWGWDPKETWAFIALMCYIVVLHGRFAGLWTNFGLAFGSVLCFQAIVMAWYGVNFVLGSGKHAYGSGTGGLGIVTTCVAMDMVFLAAATSRYMMHKSVNRKVGDDEGEDQSARGRVADKSDDPK